MIELQLIVVPPTGAEVQYRVETIGCRGKPENVIAGPTIQLIISGIANNHVVALAAEQRIAASATSQVVTPVLPKLDINAATKRNDRVRTCASNEYLKRNGW